MKRIRNTSPSEFLSFFFTNLKKSHSLLKFYKSLSWIKLISFQPLFMSVLWVPFQSLGWSIHRGVSWGSHFLPSWTDCSLGGFFLPVHWVVRILWVITGSCDRPALHSEEVKAGTDPSTATPVGGEGEGRGPGY